MKTLKRLVFLFLAATLITANIFPIKITNDHLAKFDSLLKDLSNYRVKELDCARTNINDNQLIEILFEIDDGNLRTLKLWGCYNLNYFKMIKDCTQLQHLDLSETKINNEQLTDTLNQIGENLRTLNLQWCIKLNNFKAIKDCTQLQKLDLSGTKITDEQLAGILKKMGGNLRTLNFQWCMNLHDYEVIRNWA